MDVVLQKLTHLKFFDTLRDRHIMVWAMVWILVKEVHTSARWTKTFYAGNCVYSNFNSNHILFTLDDITLNSTN